MLLQNINMDWACVIRITGREWMIIMLRFYLEKTKCLQQYLILMSQSGSADNCNYY